jgi:hypothetical protein
MGNVLRPFIIKQRKMKSSNASTGLSYAKEGKKPFPEADYLSHSFKNEQPLDTLTDLKKLIFHFR